MKDLATQMKNKLTRRYRHKASYHSYDMIQTQTRYRSIHKYFSIKAFIVYMYIRGPTQSEFSNVHARIQELAARYRVQSLTIIIIGSLVCRLCDQEEEANDEEEEEEEMVHEDEQQRERLVKKRNKHSLLLVCRRVPVHMELEPAYAAAQVRMFTVHYSYDHSLLSLIQGARYCC